MLDACGVSSPEELFAHLPDEVRLNRPLNLGPGISEYEIVEYFRDRAAECANVAEPGSLDLEDLERRMDGLTGAVIIQTPNFFGIVEQVKAAAEIAHRHGALLVVVFTEAVSLGLLEPPAGADIVAGELQSFAISPSYGGPYAGIIATKENYIRQMPGRLVAQTTDSRGHRPSCRTPSP